MSEQNSKKNRYIFSELVKDKSEVTDMVAYCLYKFEKKEYVKMVEKTQNTELSKEQLATYQEEKLEDIQKYRKEAESIVLQTINNLLTKERKIIEEKTKELEKKENKYKEKENELKNLEADLKKRQETCHVTKKGWTEFWFGVLQSVTASFIFPITAILAIKIISLILNYDLKTDFKTNIIRKERVTSEKLFTSKK